LSCSTVFRKCTLPVPQCSGCSKAKAFEAKMRLSPSSRGQLRDMRQQLSRRMRLCGCEQPPLRILVATWPPRTTAAMLRHRYFGGFAFSSTL
jgi:hypothetical protein